MPGEAVKLYDGQGKGAQRAVLGVGELKKIQLVLGKSLC
jgi:hypothetical protein